MGVPTLQVGYTSATTGRGDHEVRKGHVAVGGGDIARLLEHKPECSIHVCCHCVFMSPLFFLFGTLIICCWSTNCVVLCYIRIFLNPPVISSQLRLNPAFFLNPAVYVVKVLDLCTFNKKTVFIVVLYFKLHAFVTYEYGLCAGQEHQIATTTPKCKQALLH
jgi:hypothetical protein